MVFAGAAETMLWCGGGYIDSALDHGEKRLAKHQFGHGMAALLGDMCADLGEKPATAKKQCERSYGHLKKALKDKQLDRDVRVAALEAIDGQGRDAKTLKVAKKYTTDEDSIVAGTALYLVTKLSQ